MSRIENETECSYKIMKHLNSKENDMPSITTMDNDEWLKYYKALWYNEEERPVKMEEEYDEVDRIELAKLQKTLNKVKNRKLTE